MLKLNCGLSYPEQNAEDELEKIKLASKYGVDYVSIISIDEERTKWFWELVKASFNWNASVSVLPSANFTLCSAPLYECAMYGETIFETMERHYSCGVRAMTFHVTPKQMIDDAVKDGFIVNSRGGIFSEDLPDNPICDKWEEIVKWCAERYVTIFIGTSLRPGACEDELSKWTIKDLKGACQYYDKAIKILRDVGEPEIPVYLETLGHVRHWNLKTYEDICQDRKICAMGPLLTDSVNGFDELNAIIGYSLVRKSTSLNLQVECMLSRKEHIELPNVEDVEDEIKKWKVAETVVDCTMKDAPWPGNKAEEVVLHIKDKQRTQCSAHYNIFGAMDIIPTCNVCGSKCPLTSEKLKGAQHAS